MDADEREVYLYMKSHGRGFVPALEVCRRAGSKRRFRYDSEWARPAMVRMTERGILESDNGVRYRLKPRPKIETAGKMWASKALVKMLEAKGKPVDNLLVHQDDDEYYESL